MRSKKTIKNTFFSVLEDLVAIICSFILPKLILSNFGSAYNGLTTSISQFLACAVLLRSGIGGATRAALYKPLANNNKSKIDSILKATDIFMKRVGLILLACIIVFASAYPFFVKNEFSWFFTFSLFIIIGISTFAESFFGITYLILLQADQKLYISSIIKMISVAVNCILASILILNGQSIHVVKFGSALAFCIYPVAMNIYVRRKYKIDKNVEPDNKSIAQRWDAFWHQVAVFINNNTDVMVLTIFTNILEVSVYSVYNLVINGLKRFITAFTNGIDSAFGNMIAKNEYKLLNDNVSIIEMIIYSVSTLLYSCAIILVLQFVSIYTKGITDVNYIRPAFAYIILATQFFYAIRLPYQFIVQAAGHFKQTKKYAIVEVIINILISVALVINFGLVGVAIGSFVALLYKTIMFSNYVSDNILKRSRLVTLKKCFISIVEFFMIYGIINLLQLPLKQNYLNWIVNSIITAAISVIIISIGILLFYRNDFSRLMIKLKKIRRKG